MPGHPVDVVVDELVRAAVRVAPALEEPLRLLSPGDRLPASRALAAAASSAADPDVVAVAAAFARLSRLLALVGLPDGGARQMVQLAGSAGEVDTDLATTLQAISAISPVSADVRVLCELAALAVPTLLQWQAMLPPNNPWSGAHSPAVLQQVDPRRRVARRVGRHPRPEDGPARPPLGGRHRPTGRSARAGPGHRSRTSSRRPPTRRCGATSTCCGVTGPPRRSAARRSGTARCSRCSAPTGPSVASRTARAPSVSTSTPPRRRGTARPSSCAGRSGRPTSTCAASWRSLASGDARHAAEQSEAALAGYRAHRLARRGRRGHDPRGPRPPGGRAPARRHRASRRTPPPSRVTGSAARTGSGSPSSARG